MDHHQQLRYNLSPDCYVTPLLENGRLYIEFCSDVTLRLDITQWTMLERGLDTIEMGYYFDQAVELNLSQNCFLLSQPLVLKNHKGSIRVSEKMFDYKFYKWVNAQLETLDTRHAFHVVSE